MSVHFHNTLIVINVVVIENKLSKHYTADDFQINAEIHNTSD